MNNPSIFLSIYLVGILLTTATGAVVLSFYPRCRTPYWLMAPALGLGGILSAYTAAFLLGISIGQIIVGHCLFLPVIAYRNRSRFLQQLHRNWKSLVCAMSIPLFTFATFSWMNISHGKPYPLSNNGDAEAYCVLTDFLLHSHFPPAVPETVGSLTQIQQSCVKTGFSFGFSTFHGITSKLLGLPPIHTFQAATNFVWALIVLPVLAMIRLNRGNSTKRFIFQSFLFCFLFSTNTAILSQVGEAYAPAGVGLVLMLVCLVLIMTLDTKIATKRYWILTGIPLSALMATYSPLFVYLSTMSLLWFLVYRRNWRPFVAFATSVLVNPVSTIWFLKGLLLVVGFALAHLGGEGWQWVPLDEWLGFHHYRLGSPWTYPLLHWCGLLSVLLLMVYGLRAVDRNSRAMALIVLIVLSLVGFYARYLSIYPYMYYKNILFFAPVGVYLISVGFHNSRDWIGRRTMPVIGIVFLCIYIFSNYSILLRFGKIFPGPCYARFEAMQDVRATINTIDQSTPDIHISNIGGTEGLWLAYFLRDGDLRFDRFIPNFLYAAPLQFDCPPSGWLVPDKNRLEDLWAGAIGQDPISFFQQAEETQYILIRRQDSWRYPLEKEIHSNTFYILFQQKPGWSHLNFHKDTVVVSRPFQIQRVTDGIKIEDHHYPLTAALEKTGIIMKILGNVTINSGSLTDAQPPYYLLRTPASKGNPVIEIQPSGTIAISGSLNLVDAKLSLADLSPLPVFNPPWKPVLPNSSIRLVGGAHGLETAGDNRYWRWTKEKMVTFFRWNSDRPTRLFLKLNAFPYKPQTLKLVLNGRTLGEIALHPNEYIERSYNLREAVKTSGGNFLELETSEVYAPDAFDHKGDKRKLGLCIHDMQLVIE